MTTLNKDQQKLVSENLGLAEQVARRFGGSILCDQYEKSITMDDLKQEAVIGLCEAAVRFDEKQGVEFSTFAHGWCKRYVMAAVRQYSTPLTVPDNFVGGIDIVHLDALMGDVATAYADEDDDGSPADRIFYQIYESQKAEKEIDDEVEEEMRRTIRQAMGNLTAREQKVISWTFGLGGEELTGNEIAILMGVTPQRVGQIRDQALTKLEFALTDK